MTINPISSAQTNYANQPAQAAAPKEQQANYPQDTVSLKSAGDVDHDGDSK